MKEAVDTIFTLEKIYQAYRACQKGKRNTANALQFEYDREKNLIALLEDLQNRTYQISRHVYFIVTKPTPREIFAGDFRDRIVHHLLCNEIQSLFGSNFISRTYANRVGKGTHVAVRQLQRDLQCVRRHHPAGRYFLKLDIENFFRSISHERLWEILVGKLDTIPVAEIGVGGQQWQQEVRWLTKLIIFHNPTSNYIYRGDKQKQTLIPAHKSLFNGQPNAGLPIGNLTSQFFANVYLSELDHFVTKKLDCREYLRYVDDFVITAYDQAKLSQLVPPINKFLSDRLDLRLHPKKIVCDSGSKGVDFLGYIVRANYILVRRSVVKRLYNELRFVGHATSQAHVAGRETADHQSSKPLQLPSSYYGHFHHADSVRLRTKTTAAFEKVMTATSQ